MANVMAGRRRSAALLWAALALSLTVGCGDAAEPLDRDRGATRDGDDDQPDDDDARTDGDDDSDDDAADDDVAGSGGEGRVDAARPSAGKSDAGAPRADGGKPNVDAGAKEDASAPEPASDAGEPEASDAAAMGDAASPGEERADLGKGDGKDVVTIGDSWMLLLGTGIQESLTKVSGQPYRKYARPGTRLLDEVIPGQYATAKRADADIKTVVMTAGGNDIIQNSTLKSDCMQGGAMCDAQVAKIHARLAELWKTMSSDGVQDVIHVMYSKSAGSGVKNRDKHNESMAKVCAEVPAPLRCHLLNTDALIGPSEMRGDGIHPTDSGYDKIGKAVFELMEEKGMRR